MRTRELGITSLFVTHNQVEARTLAQRMVVINPGRMEQFGTPEEEYRRPAARFMASFTCLLPMHLLQQINGTKAGVFSASGQNIRMQKPAAGKPW